ncbi:hypothetical protein [Pseudophaeobacter sp.]|uniref:hypothetical protein n=1 Tax=Pseudophaeobacter sp. TaxID=1971739 RepID=UPI0032994303
MLNAVFILFTLHVFSLFLRDICGLHRARLILLGIGGPLGVLLSFWWPELQFVPYLAVIAINLSMAYVFGHNLLRGQPSILLQFVTFAHLGPNPSCEFTAYLRQQCAVWLGVGLLSAGLGILALVAEPLRALAGIILVTLLVAQALWFVISHEIARVRFKRPETWQRSMSLIMRRDTWKKLDI